MREEIRKGLLIAASVAFDAAIAAVRAKLEPRLGLRELASKLPLGLFTKFAATTRV